MIISNWLRSLFSRNSAQQICQSARRRTRSGRRRLSTDGPISVAADALETRTLLATFTVMNSADSGAGSLRQAVADANTAAGADTIDFDASLNGDTIALTSGEIAITDALTISGLGQSQLMIDGGNMSRIFNIDDSSATVLDIHLQGLTLARGVTTSGHGGAIDSDENLTIVDSTIRDSHALGFFARGGAIHQSGAATLSLTGTTISGATAASHGGGIRTDAATVNITDSRIVGNRTGISGAGLWASGTSSVDIQRSAVSGNTANRDGGGMYVAPGGTLAVSDSVISGNTSGATGPGGGGGLRSGGPVSITRSSITGNTSVGNRSYGAGVQIFSRTSPSSIRDTTISGNTAGGYAGGLFLSVDSELAVVNTTISGNHAGRTGGGIHGGSQVPLSIFNSTIIGNSATEGGGGIRSRSSTITIENSIVAGNSGIDGAPSELDGFTAAAGSSFNLIADAASAGGLTHGTNGNLVGDAGAGTLDTSAILGSLDNHGGPTFTHALVAGSPAIDAGDPVFDPNAFTPVLTTDQRGGLFDRVVDGGSGLTLDIGATESGAAGDLSFDLRTLNATHVLEGDAATAVIELIVRRSDTSTNASVDVSLTGSATLGGDLSLSATNVSFSAGGDSEKTVTLTVSDDALVEPDELFVVSLANPVGGSLSLNSEVVGSILNDDADLLVTTLTDEDDGSPDPGQGSGTSLREALNAANENGRPLDVIAFDPALTAGGPSSVVLTGGELLIQGDTRLLGPGSELLTIDANRASRIFRINSGNFSFDPFVRSEVQLSGLTLTGGLTTGPGGAVHNQENLTITDAVLRGNRAAGFDSGGAVFNHRYTTLTVSNATITGNTSDSLGGAILSSGRVSVSDSLITGNVAGGTGGGLFVSGDYSSLAVTGSTISGNTSRNGGGAISFDSPNTLTVSRSAISGNRSFGSGAGIVTRSTTHIEQSTISRNSSIGGSGGGIDFSSSGSLTVIGSTIHGNTTSGIGGGLWAHQGSRVSLLNSTISSNESGDAGGGVYGSSGSSLSIRHSTLAGNQSFLGNSSNIAAGISSRGSVVLSHSIVAGNLSSLGDASDLGGFTAGVGSSWNVIGDAGTAAGLMNGTDGNIVGNGGTGTRDLTTILAPLANNGGLTMTHALVAGSPAIDAGDPGAFTPALPADQRGEPFDRVVNGGSGLTVDIGATESGATGPVSFDLQTTNVTRVFEGNAGTTDIELLVSRSSTAGNADVDLLLAGDVLAGTDASLSATTVSFVDGGAASQTVMLSIAGDTDVENDEWFVVSLTNPVGGVLSLTSQVTGTVLNDDAGLIVTTLTDEDDGTTDPGQGDGTSLREAVNAANGAANGRELDVIGFDPALTAGGGVSIVLTAGELAIEGHTRIIGPGADLLTIDGSGRSRLFAIEPQVQPRSSHARSDVSISGLTLTGGSGVDGGAIHSHANLSIADSTITGNTASGSGGGIYVTEQTTLSIVSSSISGNTAGARGGGVATYTSTDVRISDSRINANSAAGSGGGFSVERNAPVRIDDSQFGSNVSGGEGGAVYSDFGIQLTISGTSITGNSASGSGGGIRANGQLSIDHSTIADNASDGSSGGGLAVGLSGSAATSITNSTISGNSVDGPGGGAYVRDRILVSNSTISGNTANSGSGGGLYVGGEDVTIQHSTVSGNSATSDGGGVYGRIDDALTLLNTIVAGNLKSGSVPGDLGGSTTNGNSAFSLIGDADTAGGLTHGDNGNIIGNAGSGTIDTSTILDPLTNNGGPTLTHELVTGSPAIDAGDPAFDPAAFDPALTTDQRDAVGRVVDGGNGAVVDIGAFEFGAVPDRTISLQAVGTTSVAEGDSGTTDLELVVTRSDTTTAVSVDLTTGGTATVNSDYTLSATSLNFLAGGAASQSVFLSVSGDTRVEFDEYFEIELANPVGAALSQVSTVVGFITNDDTATISVDDVAIDEGDAGPTLLTFTVILDRDVDRPLTAEYRTQAGTAQDETGDNDFQSAAGTLNFAGTAGEMQQVVVTLNGDGLNEPHEQFELVVGQINAGGLDVVPDPASPADFIAPREPTLSGSLSLPDTRNVALAAEGDFIYVIEEGDADLFIVDAGDPLNPAVVGTLDRSSTSSPALAVDGDYVFMAEERDDSLFVIDVSDRSSPTQVGSLSLSSVDSLAVAASGGHAFVVDSSSDLLRVIDVQTPASPSEVGSVDVGSIDEPRLASNGGFVYMVDERSDQLRIFDVTTPSAPMLAGSHDFGRLEVPALALSGTTVYVADEDSSSLFVVDVSTAAAPSVLGTVELANLEDPALAIEGDLAYVTSYATGALTVVDVSDKTSPVVVSTPSLGPSVEPVGLAVAGGFVYVVNEDSDELLTLTPNRPGTSGTATILNDDPKVNLSVSANVGTEVDQTVITLTATADFAVVGDQTVDVVVSGTGVTSGDYTLSDTTITIANGMTTGDVTFTVADDTDIEFDETATLTLSNPSEGIGLGTTVSQDIDITNDDLDTLTVSIDSASISENGGTSSATVSRTTTTGEVVVTLMSNDTGEAGVPATVTIADGQTTSPAFTITAADDGVVDGTQTVTITASATNFNPGTDTIDIEDDEFQRQYDFGTAASPLATGYTRVTDSDLFPGSPMVGDFGWNSASGLSTRDRTFVSSDLNRDYVKSGAASSVFQVSVPNGEYNVTFTIGSGSDPRTGVGVALEGTLVATVTTPAGSFVTETHMVNVADGVLTVDLQKNGPTATGINVIEIVESTFEPVVTPTVATQYYDVGDPATALDNAITITDPDDTNLTGATVSIASGFEAGSDVLAFTDQNNITGSFDAGTGVLTLVGTDTVANYQAALQSVTFQNAAGTPGTRTIEFGATDQIDTGFGTRTLTVLSGALLQYDFDFGTSSSAVETGFTAIEIDDAFNASDGYGWLDDAFNNGLSDRDRTVPDDLRADYHKIGSGSMTFGVNLPNGDYFVTAILGSNADPRNGVGVIYEGTQVATVSTSAGQFAEVTERVTVSDGRLEVKVDKQGSTGVSLNGLQILEATNAPDVTPQSGPLFYQIGSAATVVDDMLTVTDPNDTNLTGATVSITDGFVQGEDVLAFTDQLGITGSYDGNTGVLSLSGTTTVANYQTALRTVTYENTNGSAASSTREITFAATDPASDTGTGTREIGLQDPFPGSVSYDFGSQTSDVEAGFIGVNETTVFTAASGYGFLSTGGIDSRNRNAPVPLDERRDYVRIVSGSMTFAVTVPNGDYDVTFTIGSSENGRNNVGVLMEGMQVATVNTTAGQFAIETYRVTVSDNRLEVEIARQGASAASINALVIDAVP